MNRLRKWLGAIVIAACVPYLSLKIAWAFGSRIGIPEGSELRDAGTTMVVAGALAVLMAGAVIVLALLLTRPWGRRAPAWLLLLPLWTATGLLALIVIGFPLQLVVGALGGSAGTESAGQEPFLDAWVFSIVYGGFIVQGLALGTLFALYARDRWGHLWRGRLRDLPAGAARPAQRMAAITAVLFALLPLAMHLLWAGGSTAGLSEGRAEDDAGSFAVVEAVYVLLVLAAIAGTLMIVYRIGRGVPVRVPLGLAWVGSGALACWGGWLLLSALVSQDAAKRLTFVMSLTYAVHVIVGVLILAIGAAFFAERSATLTRDAAVAPASRPIATWYRAS